MLLLKSNKAEFCVKLLQINLAVSGLEHGDVLVKVDVPEFPVSGVKFVVVIRYTPSD